MKLSREAEISFLKSKGVEMNFEKAMYSINKGIWGTSVGGKETLNSLGSLPESAFPTQLEKKDPETVVLHFDKGELRKVNDISFKHPVDAIHHLQSIAGPYAIGRDIHVGDTIIGIKGRVGFEAAAPMLVLKAHHALEKHVLTKWQLSWKDQLAQFYGNWLHEGQYLDPVMRDLEAFLTSTQKHGEMNMGWTGDDVRGFSKIFGNQTMIYQQVANSADTEP
jgi:argininosuccinate synthase